MRCIQRWNSATSLDVDCGRTDVAGVALVGMLWLGHFDNGVFGCSALPRPIDSHVRNDCNRVQVHRWNQSR